MSEVSIQLKKVLSISDNFKSKDLYLKLSAGNKSFITKTVKAGSNINWSDICKFELTKSSSSIAILIELWEYDFELTKDYSENLLGSSDMLIHMNEMQRQ